MNMKWFGALLASLLLSFASCSSDDPQLTNPDKPNTSNNGSDNSGNNGSDNSGDKEELPEYPALDRSKIAAFPGAYGAGRYTTGGAGGTVYVVTKLTDDGSEGTLRWAVNKTGKRTIVFATGGLIQLNSELSIKNGDLTIAGQSAPGAGICLKGHPVSVKADNVIIRFIRFRMGSENLTASEAEGADALWGKEHKNIIIDHCSMSWSTDECSSFYDNSNFTMQWCIISESLAKSLHVKGTHGYGGIWGGSPATFHHNLMAHHGSRTPRLCGSRFNGNPDAEMVDLRNNVFYNWGPTNGAYAGEGGGYNIVNNYYKPGPSTATKKSIINRIFQPNADDGTNKNVKGIWGTFHLSGNWFDGSCSYLKSEYQSLITQVNDDNYVGLQPKETTDGPLPEGGKDAIISKTEYTISSDAADFTQSAQDAFESVLKCAGASLNRDAVDERVINNVRNGDFTADGGNGSQWGIIDNAIDVGGWPEYAAGTAVVDTDKDGIPDAWEKEKGLNPEDATDGVKYNLSKEYTNLEVYLNGLVENLYIVK